MKKLSILSAILIFCSHYAESFIDTTSVQIGKEKMAAYHVVKGQINLYAVIEYETVVDSENGNYFVTKEEPFLVYYLKVHDEMIHVHPSNYKKVVRKYLPNAPYLHKRLGKVGFRFESLRYMVEFYNKHRTNKDIVKLQNL